MHKLQELIFQALQLKDNNLLRSQAQSQIFALFKQNTTSFFLECATIVGNDSKNTLTIQSTASIMKTLLSRKDQSGKWFWDSVSINMRPQIKQAVLSTLVSPNVIVMRAGANVIAQIAAIQISRGEWLDIINTLAQNTTHQDPNIRRASITTLGYICEQSKAIGSQINSLSCEQILGCLLLGLSPQNDRQIIQISLQALRDSIPFLKSILQNQQFCSKTMQIVFVLLQNDDYRNKVYEILFQFGKHCYQLLHNYVNSFIQLSVRHIQQRNDNSILALQLWDTIGTEYVERKTEQQERISTNPQPLQNILHLVHEVVLPEVMACILIIKQQDVEFPELRQAAVKTLTTFVECGSRKVADMVTDGVSRIIQSSHAGQRQASALLFGCLSQFYDKQYVKQCFTQGFPYLFKLLSDTDHIVLKNTLNGFVILSQKFGFVFLTNSNVNQIFNHLIELSKHKDEDIRILSLSVLCNITQFLKDQPNPICRQPDQYLGNLVPKYIQNFKLYEQKQTNQKLLLVIMNIIINTDKKTIISQLIFHTIDQYYQFYKINIPDKQIVLQSLMTLLHTSILSLSKFTTINQPKDRIFEMIDFHIKHYGPDSQALNLISAASLCYRIDFMKKIDFYWHHITNGLMHIDQKVVFKAALNCISDISRTYQSEVCDKIVNVFHLMIKYMSENIDRELKSQILKSLGDLLLGLKRYGQIYVDTILDISCNCYEAVYKLAENERPYADQLKQSLIQMYHCVLFSLNDQNHCDYKMAAHFPLICTFIVRTCHSTYKPTVEYIKNCLYLIFDSALLFAANQRYRGDVDRILRSNQIRELADSIRKYSQRQDINDLLQFIDAKVKWTR